MTTEEEQWRRSQGLRRPDKAMLEHWAEQKRLDAHRSAFQAAEEREREARAAFERAVLAGDLATAGTAFVALRRAMAERNGLHERLGVAYPHADVPKFSQQVDLIFAKLPSIAYRAASGPDGADDGTS